MKRAYLIIILAVISLNLNAKNTDVSVADTIKPEFAGGREAFRSHLRENFKIPDFLMYEVKASKITIIVEFTVDVNGNVRNPNVIQPGCCGTDEEGIKFVESTSGKWIPAKVRNEPIEYVLKQPLTFITETVDSVRPVPLEKIKEKYEKWLKKNRDK